MKQLAMFAILTLWAASTGITQDSAAARPAAQTPAAAEAAATDDAQATSPLEQLDWMVGQWIDKGENSTITTDCNWTKNRKFLVRSFSIATDGQLSMEGTQVVGWGPIAKQIRSWTFDSEGGFGEGRWIKDGNRWVVKASFTLPSGQRASAVNVFTYVDPNTFRWQSIDREVAGELQPNIPEVTVVRQDAEKTGSEEAGKEVSR